jgi:hypothetical protein
MAVPNFNIVTYKKEKEKKKGEGEETLKEWIKLKMVEERCEANTGTHVLSQDLLQDIM